MDKIVNNNVEVRKKFSIKSLPKRKQLIIYITAAVLSLILIIVLSIVLSNTIRNRIELERTLEEKKQIYQELVQEQINLQDSEYAIVYIDDSSIVIPNSKIIIEYTNK